MSEIEFKTDYRPSKALPFRYRGIIDSGESLTEQDSVPTLPQILTNVLQGRPTGLAQQFDAAFDDESDFDPQLTDTIDIEANRQKLIAEARERALASKQAKQSTDASSDGVKADAADTPDKSDAAPSETPSE